MRRSKFPDETIIGILREHEAGLPTADLCRKSGISDATFYKWRAKYGGMDASDTRKLRAIEEDNRRLKKLLAESMLDVSTLREMLGKNV
jgi:putative transposase